MQLALNSGLQQEALIADYLVMPTTRYQSTNDIVLYCIVLYCVNSALVGLKQRTILFDDAKYRNIPIQEWNLVSYTP